LLLFLFLATVSLSFAQDDQGSGQEPASTYQPIGPSTYIYGGFGGISCQQCYCQGCYGGGNCIISQICIGCSQTGGICSSSAPAPQPVGFQPVGSQPVNAHQPGGSQPVGSEHEHEHEPRPTSP